MATFRPLPPPPPPECPKCRYVMTRWRTLIGRAERPVLDWSPDRWALDYPWQGIVLVLLLGLLMPSMAIELSLAAPVLFLVFALVWAFLAMWHTLWRRRHRRRQLSKHVKLDDWVCPRCLSSRPDS